MSNDPTFCISCQHYSDDPATCTHCGEKILVPDMDAPSIPPVYGRLRITLKKGIAPGSVWSELGPVWQEEAEAKWPFLEPSQIDQFQTGSDTVEVFGPQSMVEKLAKVLGHRGAIDFEERPQEEMPWYDPNSEAKHPGWSLERLEQRRKGKGKA